jgi:hypothetical protein
VNGVPTMVYVFGARHTNTTPQNIHALKAPIPPPHTHLKHYLNPVSYPGLCNKQDWPSCGTGTLLAVAVPA